MSETTSSGRLVGIAHRVKKTKDGEARPTRVCIIDPDGKSRELVLATETEELDFVLGRYPVKNRAVADGEPLSQFLPHHVQWRKAKKDEDLDGVHPGHLRLDKKDVMVASKAPSEYDGLRPGDKVALILSGSGNRLAYALSNRGSKIGAEVFHLPSYALENVRTGNDKAHDHVVLAQLLCSSTVDFHHVTVRDRALIALKDAYTARVEAMKARIGCEQRLRSVVSGQIYCNPEGCYPEGDVELVYARAKANDVVYKAFVTEEASRERELVKMVSGTDVYKQLFEPIEGMGPLIAARLIVSIGDIRRFKTKERLKAYCGVHVLKDGRFARRRNNEVANWSEEARNALYLLGDQFNRRPDSVWGLKQREYKEKFRNKHPEMCKQCGVEWVDCEHKDSHKRTYSPAHIQRMATWRTITKFTEWLWREWTRIERANDVSIEVVDKSVLDSVVGME